MAQQGGQGQYPVDNNTYNLVSMLHSKLEALDAYRKYEKDANEQSRGLIQEMMQQDRQAAQRLLDALKQTLR